MKTALKVIKYPIFFSFSHYSVLRFILYRRSTTVYSNTMPDKLHKHFEAAKSSFINKLYGERQYPRFLMIERMTLQCEVNRIQPNSNSFLHRFSIVAIFFE